MFQEMHWLPYTIIPKTSLYTTRYGILKKGHWGDLHTHIYCQVQNNAPVRDLSNLCVLVLLQKTIPWPLAFESVVWDITRITENQTINLMINLEIFFGIFLLLMGFMFWLLAWTMDWQAIECSCLLSILTTITWGRPCTVLPWGSFSWSPQRRSRVARERSLRGPAPTGNLVNGQFIGRTLHQNFWDI